MNRAIPLVAILLALGCQKRTGRPPVVENENDYVLAVLIDLSGSFSREFAERGKAHSFLLRIVDTYFRDRIGTNDQIIIAQISAADRSLLWQGTPLELRREFPSAAKFRDFLLSKADPTGSLVHDALTQTCDYVMSQPSVASGRAKSAVFVLSDMEDNGPEPGESKERV